MTDSVIDNIITRFRLRKVNPEYSEELQKKKDEGFELREDNLALIQDKEEIKVFKSIQYAGS